MKNQIALTKEECITLDQLNIDFYFIDPLFALQDPEPETIQVEFEDRETYSRALQALLHREIEGTRIITIPNRDKEGWLHGTKKVRVKWNCPICNQKIGEPTWRNFCEDGEHYVVNVWENPCGHITKYTDLKIL